jgi:hypothetical protein
MRLQALQSVQLVMLASSRLIEREKSLSRTGRSWMKKSQLSQRSRTPN